MDQICHNCDRLFEGGDVVKALVIAKWVSLKSKVNYALERPTDCLEVVHLNCQHAKGVPEGD